MLVSLLFANFIALRYHGDVARADSVTTTTSPSKQITGGSLALLQLSEQQFQNGNSENVLRWLVKQTKS